VVVVYTWKVVVRQYLGTRMLGWYVHAVSSKSMQEKIYCKKLSKSWIFLRFLVWWTLAEGRCDFPPPLMNSLFNKVIDHILAFA